MSGILRNKKRLAVFSMGGMCILALTCALGCPWYIALLIVILYVMLFFINEYIYKKMNDMRKPFDVYSEIRNVDYLIIGGFCHASQYVPNGKNYVQISAPNRGYHSSYQILRHTHSILKETGGTVVIAMGRSRKDFMLFDIPFLHSITIQEYKLTGLKKQSRFPMIFAPIDTLKFARSKVPEYEVAHIEASELQVFCEERDYRLVCLREL